MTNLVLGAGGAAADDYTIDQSLRFDGTSYLTRTPGSAGNSKTWTVSFWTKLEISAEQKFFDIGTVSSSETSFAWGDGTFYFKVLASGSENTTTSLYRDPSSWYHVVVAVDTTQATDTDRVKIYVNGEQLTDFSATSYPAQDSDTNMNTTKQYNIGRLERGDQHELESYLAEYYSIDGTAYDADDFGETDSATNQWIPKDASGLTFGTNGFYQKYAGDIGAYITGDRTSTVTVTASGFTPSGTIANFVNGVKAGNNTDAWYFPADVSNTDFVIHFDMSTAVNISEATMNQGYPWTSNTHGTWQWQGSTNDSDWDDIGATFTLGGSANQVQTTLNGNTSEYRYYRLLGITGTVSSSPYIAEIEFKQGSGSFGTDSSGNGNTFTVTNLVATDQMVDSPTNNFATLNSLVYEPVYANDPTYSEGNLKASVDSASYTCSPQGSIFAGGKWYCEILAGSNVIHTPYPYPLIGVFPSDFSLDTVARVDQGDAGTYWYMSDGEKMGDGGSAVSYGNSWTTGDIVSIAVDMDNGGNVYFAKNGTWQDSGDPTSGATATGAAFTGLAGSAYAPVIQMYGAGSASEIIANFGSDSSFAGEKTAQGNTDSNGVGDFYYEPPTDYLALCTSNLSAPEIKLPGDYFETVLYTGTGVSPNVISTSFQSDLAWIKQRNAVDNHTLYDAIRGGTNAVRSSSDAAEGSFGDTVLTFNSDNISMAGTGGNNVSGETSVIWNWLAATTFDPKTDGDISAASGQSNATAGFSIVKYTGESGTPTVGHGLGVTPDLIIIKQLTSGYTYEWNVASLQIGSGAKRLVLNTDAAQATGSGLDSPYIGSSVFTLSDGTSRTNDGSSDYIAYCFASIEGYSKVGKYTGNGNADGAFVYLGFRPAFTMLKRIDSADDWFIEDNKRNTYNVVDNVLYPDLTNAEYSEDHMDYVSNGMKFRLNNANWNASGGTYLYLAFAESPFKYANAR